MHTNYTIKHRELCTDIDFPDTVSNVLQRIYAARQIQNQNDLDYSLTKLHSVTLLSGIDKAVSLLTNAILENQSILIVGDFDADGATSTALAIRALRAMGAQSVNYLVPNRFEYGYGLTPEIVEVAKSFSPDLLITVDNGISSIAGVAAAKSNNIKVLVTDHHLPGRELPDADAIVNPNLQADDFPSKCLAGVGVIFYVLSALRTTLREQNWFVNKNIAEPNMANYLDLVALGTVADVVPLDKNNRVLVDQGLRRIRAGKCIPGINALIKVGKKDQANLIASDFGFAVAPRLNAAGRLEDMSLGIECLLTDDDARAMSLAQELDSINIERRSIEKDMKLQAEQIMQSTLSKLNTDKQPAGVCLYDERWHQGVVGILASRVKENFNRPVIAFAKVSDSELKGSGRSIPGIHIRDVLDAVATQYPGLITKFGGHAMAAGLSLSIDKFTEFQAVFDLQVRSQLNGEIGAAVILTDGVLDSHEMNLKTAEELRYAGPWGQEFPEPVFDGFFEVVSYRVVGEHHLKLVLKRSGTKEEFDAIAFNHTDDALPKDNKEIKVVYRLEVNEFRGIKSVQLNIQYLEALN